MCRGAIGSNSRTQVERHISGSVDAVTTSRQHQPVSFSRTTSREQAARKPTQRMQRVLPGHLQRRWGRIGRLRLVSTPVWSPEFRRIVSLRRGDAAVHASGLPRRTGGRRKTFRRRSFRPFVGVRRQRQQRSLLRMMLLQRLRWGGHACSAGCGH